MHSLYLKSTVGHGFVEIVDIVSHYVNSRIDAMVSLGTVTASSSAASVKVVFLTLLSDVGASYYYAEEVI